MKYVDWWMCPDLLSGPGKYLKRAQEDAPKTIALCKEKRVAIQAGGHIGTWPVFLSWYFEMIYSFEPGYDNFQCLTRNVHEFVERPERIFLARGVLGNKRGPIEMVLSGKSTGQHKVRYPNGPGLGTVPSYRIDDLELPVVDALFLDVEGYEQYALMGGRETIKRCRPIIMVECNKRVRDHGFKDGDLEVCLRQMDYALHESVYEDQIYVPLELRK